MRKKAKMIPVLVPCADHEWDDLALTAFQAFKKDGKREWICPACFGDQRVNDEGVRCVSCGRKIRAMVA